LIPFIKIFRKAKISVSSDPNFFKDGPDQIEAFVVSCF
jgi:hypothetical protein